MFTTINQAMDALLGDVLIALGPDSHKDFCIATKFPGEGVPLDYGAESSCKGTLWVRLVTAFPSTTFPNPSGDPNACWAPLAYPLEVGILRKAPIPKTPMGKIKLPSAQEHAEATDKMLNDMEAMRKGIQLLRKDVEMLVTGTYQPVGPDGGLVGGIWSLTIGLQ